jgi:transcriptional regulator with XRE-family HTH domain
MALREEPGRALDRLCREQGRRKDWIAEELGISKSALSKRIAGLTPLTKLEAEKLAAIFDVPVATFRPEEE